MLEWPDEGKADGSALKDSAALRCHPPGHSICTESHADTLSTIEKLYGSRKVEWPHLPSLSVTHGRNCA